MRKLFLLTLLTLAVPSALFAQDDWRNRRGRNDSYRRGDNAFELTPFVGYTYGGRLFADQTGLAMMQRRHAVEQVRCHARAGIHARPSLHGIRPRMAEADHHACLRQLADRRHAPWPLGRQRHDRWPAGRQPLLDFLR